MHLSNSLPTLAFNNGYEAFNTFYPAVQDSQTKKLKCALEPSEDKENEEAEDGVSFTKAHQVAMDRNEGDTTLDIFMKHHERLNHPPTSVMHPLAEKRKLPKPILDIKSTPMPIMPLWDCTSQAMENESRPWEH